MEYYICHAMVILVMVFVIGLLLVWLLNLTIEDPPKWLKVIFDLFFKIDDDDN